MTTSRERHISSRLLRAPLLVLSLALAAVFGSTGTAQAVEYASIKATATDGVFGTIAKGSACGYWGSYCKASQTIKSYTLYGEYWIARTGFYHQAGFGYFYPSGGWYRVGRATPGKEAVHETECTTWACDWIKSRGGG